MRSALSSEACRNEKTSCKDPCRRSVKRGNSAARPPAEVRNERSPAIVRDREKAGRRRAGTNRNAQRSGKRKPSPIPPPPRNRCREGARNRSKEVSRSPDAKGPRRRAGTSREPKFAAQREEEARADPPPAAKPMPGRRAKQVERSFSEPRRKRPPENRDAEPLHIRTKNALSRNIRSDRSRWT